ncbi:hypothetical protein ILUMI_17302 [Ignelater luminosus]|uniref:Uncharacterized protein n=1 Tax=Ignelater luminosus TaxID=2038154 RepID=A0A8K0G7N9_IGNLU|nr:hypothetical protein ILUMI_17302 [Ignelater luminosus]
MAYGLTTDDTRRFAYGAAVQNETGITTVRNPKKKKEDNYDSSSEDENIAYKELSETVTCEPEEIDYDTIFEEKFAIVKLPGGVFT